MKKINSSKNIIIAIIIVVIVVFLVSVSSTNRNKSKEVGLVQSLTNDVTATVDKVVAFPFKAINNGVHSVSNLFSTYDDNERLKRRLDEYVQLESENQTHKQEIKELKEQLSLNETISSYDKVNAAVISRSPDTWQDILIINRGTKDGVDVDMPVLGNKGLIGRVLSANAHSAKVELLTSTNKNTNHFPVMLTPDGEAETYGLMEEYSEDEEAFVVRQFKSLEGVKVGDKVTTSGLGKTSPRGLLVGEVKKIEDSKFGLNKEVYVKPASSMYDISVVTVVQRAIESDE